MTAIDSIAPDCPPETAADAATVATASGSRPAERARSVWLAVAALGLGGFVVVTAEFLPASVLSLIAADLGISEGLAGQAVTATAVMGLLTAPTLAALVPNLDRRLLLAGLTGLALVSNVVVALAPSFPLLLVSRLLLGIAIAGFWSISLAAVAQLVPAERLGRAMTVVNAGVSLATVAAVPLGSFLGDAMGWRPVFWLAAGAAAVTLVLQLAWLPPLRPSGAPGLRTLWETSRSRVVLVGLLAIAFIAGGHFSAFTYIRPAAELVPGLGSAGLATLLVVFGVAAFVGNLVAGPLADARLGTVLLLAPVLLGVATTSFALVSDSFAAVLVAVAAWGAAFGGVPTLAQTWVARVEPDRLESASGLVVMMFQLAIAVGAAVGGLMVETVGIRTSLVVGGVAAAVGGVLISSTQRGRRTVG
ncbi:MFS transporter [Nocardioides sp. SYSU D00038]|uniref:MFS transporter n=1 Tax=Nocardioides sp. SYSU D00038 TaxID=2812554 RepID=UPI00196858D5|nr:MFS transporter [Nocardioides sp. SYSU D00038]